MNKGLEWFVKNAALPTAMVVIASAAAGLYQAGEVKANDYRMLRNSFKKGTPPYRVAVAEAMQSGKVSRWEYTGLLQQYRQENRVLSVETTATNLAEERVVLAAMARQVKAPRFDEVK